MNPRPDEAIHIAVEDEILIPIREAGTGAGGEPEPVRMQNNDDDITINGFGYRGIFTLAGVFRFPDDSSGIKMADQHIEDEITDSGRSFSPIADQYTGTHTYSIFHFVKTL